MKRKSNKPTKRWLTISVVISVVIGFMIGFGLTSRIAPITPETVSACNVNCKAHGGVKIYYAASCVCQNNLEIIISHIEDKPVKPQTSR